MVKKLLSDANLCFTCGFCFRVEMLRGDKVETAPALGNHFPDQPHVHERQFHH